MPRRTAGKALPLGVTAERYVIRGGLDVRIRKQVHSKGPVGEGGWGCWVRMQVWLGTGPESPTLASRRPKSASRVG